MPARQPKQPLGVSLLDSEACYPIHHFVTPMATSLENGVALEAEDLLQSRPVAVADKGSAGGEVAMLYQDFRSGWAKGRDARVA